MFNWKDFITLAEELIKQEDEASLRTAIDRAYYGIFCTARDKAGLQEKKTKNVHMETASFYNDAEDENKKYISDGLDELRKYRNYASYDLNWSDIDKNLATLIVLKAKKILEILEELK